MISLRLNEPWFPQEDECWDERYEGATAGCRWCGADHKPGWTCCHHGCGWTWTVHFARPERTLMEVAGEE